MATLEILPDFITVEKAAKRWNVDTNEVIQLYDEGKVKLFYGALSNHLIPYDREALLKEVRDGEGGFMAQMDFVRDHLCRLEATTVWLSREDVYRLEQRQPDTDTSQSVPENDPGRPVNVRRAMYVAKYGEVGADARLAEEARQAAIDAAELSRANRRAADEITAPSGTSKNAAPVQRHQFQEAEILRVISECGYSANALPKTKPGKSGVKAQVRAQLNMSVGIFNKAWERLRARCEIEDAS